MTNINNNNLSADAAHLLALYNACPDEPEWGTPECALVELFARVWDGSPEATAAYIARVPDLEIGVDLDEDGRLVWSGQHPGTDMHSTVVHDLLGAFEHNNDPARVATWLPAHIAECTPA